MTANEDSRGVLAPGTQLLEFEIERVLGSGGFGVTYLARDRSLERAIALKEYVPQGWTSRRGGGMVGPRSGSEADYRWGLDRFLREARTLARFRHPSIVSVLRVFEANGTAYLVMEYVKGPRGEARSLAQDLGRRGMLPETRVRELLLALTDGLTPVHAAGLLHRDIKPDNVMLRADGSPVLIDFGAARQATGQRSRAVTSVLTPGYAPIEQYSTAGNQGPWTDVYALGAVGYQALSGVRPVEAPTRTEEDRLLPLAVVARRPVSRGLARAVDEALRVFGRDRPRDLASWRELLEAPDGRPPDGPQRVRAAAPPRGGPSAPVPSPPTPPGPAPPQPSPPAPAAAAGRAPEYAGFGRRLLAFCLDSLVTAFGAFLVSLVLALVLALGAAFGEGAAGAAGPPDSEPSEAIGAFVLLAAVALAWLHEALLVSGSRQATLGKMAVGIVVTDLRGRRISFLRATGRWCGKCVSGLVLAIGYLVQPFTERRQALHDIMAGCLVLRRSRAGGGSPR